MVDALIVSNVLLWVLVLGLAGVVLALVRQIGILHERVAPAGALAAAAGPAPGEPGPVLDLEDWAGRRFRVGGEAPDGRSTLLLFVSPACPVCKTLLPIVDSVRAAEGRWLRVVVASDGTRAEHERFVSEQRLEAGGYVLSTELALRYRVGRLPHAVLLDEHGIVRAAGLVNTREHLESLFVAGERASAEASA